MSLLDDLRGIENFTPSHQPVLSEVLEVVGKLVAYIEHGDELLKAADQDAQARQAGEPALHVNDLLAPPSEDEVAARTPTQAQAAGSAKDAEIAQLRQELATAQALNQRTTATVTPAPEPTSLPPTVDQPAVVPAPEPAPAADTPVAPAPEPAPLEPGGIPVTPDPAGAPSPPPPEGQV